MKVGSTISACYHQARSVQGNSAKLMECRKDNQEQDFNLKGKVLIPCGEKTLVVDWSCVQTSTELLRFV